MRPFHNAIHNSTINVIICQMFVSRFYFESLTGHYIFIIADLTVEQCMCEKKMCEKSRVTV